MKRCTSVAGGGASTPEARLKPPARNCRFQVGPSMAPPVRRHVGAIALVTGTSSVDSQHGAPWGTEVNHVWRGLPIIDHATQQSTCPCPEVSRFAPAQRRRQLFHGRATTCTGTAKAHSC
jgi:hypothetical protein